MEGEEGGGCRPPSRSRSSLPLPLRCSHRVPYRDFPVALANLSFVPSVTYPARRPPMKSVKPTFRCANFARTHKVRTGYKRWSSGAGASTGRTTPHCVNLPHLRLPLRRDAKHHAPTPLTYRHQALHARAQINKNHRCVCRLHGAKSALRGEPESRPLTLLGVGRGPGRSYTGTTIPMLGRPFTG